MTIEMVNRGIVDGAYVHGHIYDYLARERPEKIENVRIAEVSEPFGIPPIVCPAGIDSRRFELFRDVFLNLHNDSQGRAILERLDIDRFKVVDDRIYDRINVIKSSIHEADD
jgi:phosphonate transport system substrate-binding protein